jgi:hypothetical protein
MEPVPENSGSKLSSMDYELVEVDWSGNTYRISKSFQQEPQLMPTLNAIYKRVKRLFGTSITFTRRGKRDR